MTETSTTALARSTWTCTRCGRGWPTLWSRGDKIRDVPRWFRDTPWYEVPTLVVVGPLVLIIMLIEGTRCPECGGKCVR